MEKSKYSPMLCLLATSCLSFNDVQSTRKVKEQIQVVMGLEGLALDDIKVAKDTKKQQKHKSPSKKSAIEGRNNILWGICRSNCLNMYQMANLITTMY